MKNILSLALLALAGIASAQDTTKTKFDIKDITNCEITSVKNQAKSGTCWSYSGNSFLESEMARSGKKPVELAQLFVVRKHLEEKAEAYVRLHGNMAWGEGGEFHDLLHVYEKYGALPQSVYPGLNYGTDKNNTGELEAILKGMLDGVVKNSGGKLTPVWKKAFDAVLDVYLGAVPDTFTYEGKEYTPLTFAKEVVKIDPKDYIEIGSFSDQPYYNPATFMVTDNWRATKVMNVKMDDLTSIIDNALKNGYTVGWGADVSEKYFSWKKGIAFVPEKDWNDMEEAEQKALFDESRPDRTITTEMRQQAYDNYETTDDHGMHIVALAKDQNGKEYYKVKNSWGTKNNPYQGYIYITKAYAQYKTTSILVNKAAVPKNIKANFKE